MIFKLKKQAKTTRKTKTKAITTRKTRAKAITTRKTKTKQKQTIIPSISKLRSYSPTINKEITRMNISPRRIFDPTNCQDKQLSINGKCYNWNSKK